MFASEPAEYLWYRGLISDRHTPPTVAEAQRAVSFVFWWIVRWEAFSATYVSDRRTARLVSQRRTRNEATTRGFVAHARLEPNVSDGYDLAHLQLANVPPDEAFRGWAYALTERMTAAAGERCYVENDGTLTVRWPHDADPETLASAVVTALRLAEDDVTSVEERAVSHAAQAEAADIAYRARAVGHTMPAWCLDVGFGSDMATGAAGTPLSLRIDPAFAPDSLYPALRGHPEVTDFYHGIGDLTALYPALDPPDLARVLWEIDAVLKPVHDEHMAAERSLRDAATTRGRALEAAIDRICGDG